MSPGVSTPGLAAEPHPDLLSGPAAESGPSPMLLLDSEARVLLESLPDGIAVFDANLRACYVNRVWSERRLVQRLEPEAGSVEPAFNAPTQPLLLQAMNRLRAGASEASVIVERTRPGLQPEAFELRLRRLPISSNRDGDGEDKRLILVQAHDITQQLRTERAHRETESLLGAIFETADVGLCLFDQRGRFVNVNRGYCELFGYRPEELVGRHYTKVLPAEEHEHAQRIFERFMAGHGATPSREASDQPDAVEARGRRRDGATLYIAMSTRLLIREDGRRFQVCSVIDITDRKEHARELEERASQARAEADQKSRLLNELDGKLELIQHQHQQILDLSAPILDLWEGILVLPIIGALSVERAAAVIEKLLDAVVRRRTRFVLLDLTSARDLESGSAEHIGRMISAVKLLGGQTLLTGLSAEAARTLALRGFDLSGVRALRSLAEALRACLPERR